MARDPVRSLRGHIDSFREQWRATGHFTELSNPYVAGHPIKRADMCFGRERDLSNVRVLLNNSPNNLILLTGMRRIGKTTVLHQLQRSDEPVAVFLDMQRHLINLRDNDMEPGGFWLHSITDARSDAGGMGHAPPFPTALNAQAVAGYLDGMCAGTTSGLLLLVDELDGVQFHHERGRKVLGFLMEVLRRARNTRCVATASEGFSAELNDVERYRIGMLDATAAGELATVPMGTRVRYESTGLEALLRATGRHPYFIQAVCWKLISTLNQRRTNRVSLALLQETILDDLVFNPVLEYSWEHLPSYSRQAAAAFADVLSSEDEWIQIELAFGTYPLGECSRLRLGLEHLCELGWMEQSQGGARFHVDVLRRWLLGQRVGAGSEFDSQ